LYALVRSADVTVAHSSTVIQEAAQLGVPSVVTSDYGAEFHAGLVHAGQALKATTPAAIAGAVREMVDRPRSDSPLVVQGNMLQAAVDDFFKSAPRRQPHSEPAPA
jgi:predicted glycosyltransferase